MLHNAKDSGFVDSVTQDDRVLFNQVCCKQGLCSSCSCCHQNPSKHPDVMLDTGTRESGDSVQN